MRATISDFLNSKFGLTLKENWQVFLFDWKNRGRDLDFMGFRFYRTRITLRKTIMLKASRKAKKINKKEHPTVYDLRQMMSYLGWLKCTDTYRMYLKHIKPFVSFRRMRRYISKHDKKDDYRTYLKLASLYQT